MIPFFGILSPEVVKHADAEEAPLKKSFFGGPSDTDDNYIPLTRAERDACYLNGKLGKIDPVEEVALRPFSSVARYYF
ncbi:MAG: hypothetical protein P0Y65_12170 [Candidatus Devosia phytovorans]|uniref:Uncharacterized protein n=1 Tax=Candidatus Devosia phytovorans TaxID=3121372 RepID=A0AAJ6AZY8_9HYPH|nr:hypothetical protein [Devosia sp.]WEK02963.1 MAG: hypothetical protein P0Y65_12170 [Devosia sp.]